MSTTASTQPGGESAGPAQRGKIRRLVVGTVVSDKRDKTCTVTVQFQMRHGKYGKYLQRRARYHVHDPRNQAKVGDRVQITPCRPMSKTKAWRLVSVVGTT